MHTTHERIQLEGVIIKEGSLTVVLTILADGGSGRQCQVTVGNKEIYLGDVEALEFLQEKKGMTRMGRRWTDGMMTETETETEREREGRRKKKTQIFVSAEFVLC